MIIGREFYLGDTVEIARSLIGCVLVNESEEGMASGIIVETEAYVGPGDAAAHSHRGKRDGRTRIQYGPGGFSYVYFIYGMHCCMNVVTAPEERPEAILIRALEPVSGIELMKKRRGTQKLTNLCGGPGKLCAAMGIDRSHYGLDMCRKPLYIEWGEANGEIGASPRINVDYAGEAAFYPWRFFLRESPYVSVREGRK